MTTSVVATAFGGPENLSVIDEPTQDPAPGKVRVVVRAAGVNPIDYKLYSGARNADPATLPIRLGLEASGVVDAVGEGVTAVAVGDEVIAYPTDGAYTTDLVTAADSVVAKPADLGWDEAAGLLLTGATAVHALAVVGAKDGDTILVHGGAGGVGLMALQLAALRGATVIATASQRNHDLLRSLGAVPVTYGEGLADRVRSAAPQGVTAALDLVGTDEALDVSLELVADRGRIATIANFVRAPGEGIHVVGGMDPEGVAIRKAARADLLDLVRAGKLTVRVASRHPLADAADAHREIIAGHTVGKIVLTV